MMISKNNRWARRQTGVSLIEVLVTLVLISVALLGSASLQVLSKRSNHEALQRTAAAHLAADYLERVRSNKSALEGYVPASVLGEGSQGDVPSTNCVADGANCTDSQLAAFDLWQWEQQLDGASELIDGVSTGGLLSPTACIRGPAGGVAGVYEVAIAWRGLNEHVDPNIDNCGVTSGKYGVINQFRHVLVMRTFVNTD